jgi:hypothetical protein
MWLSETVGSSPPDTFLNVGFVGLFDRTPLATANAQPSADKVQLEMVCVKPKAGGDSDEGSSSPATGTAGSSATATGGAASASSSGAAMKGMQQAGSLLVGLTGLLGCLRLF